MNKKSVKEFDKALRKAEGFSVDSPVYKIFTATNSEDYWKLINGIEFINFDSSTEDGRYYLEALAKSKSVKAEDAFAPEEGWNTLWQTLNLGAVVCMVKNTMYDELVSHTSNTIIKNDLYLSQIKKVREEVKATETTDENITQVNNVEDVETEGDNNE